MAILYAFVPGLGNIKIADLYGAKEWSVSCTSTFATHFTLLANQAYAPITIYQTPDATGVVITQRSSYLFDITNQTGYQLDIKVINDDPTYYPSHRRTVGFAV